MKGCLLFLKLASAMPSGVPANIETLAKDRIKTQYTAAHSEIEFSFDQGTCENRGTYEFADDGLRLKAENLVWPGERSYPLTQIIDGKALEFPTPLVDLTPVLAVQSAPRSYAWVAPTLIVSGVAILVGVLLANRHHSAPQPAAQPTAQGTQPTRVMKF